MGETINPQTEDLEFRPPDDFVKNANISDPDIYRKADEDFEAFWEELAEDIEWFQRWERVLEWKAPHSKWFVGGN